MGANRTPRGSARAGWRGATPASRGMDRSSKVAHERRARDETGIVRLFDKAREHFDRYPANWDTHCANLAAAMDAVSQLPDAARPSLAALTAMLGNALAVMTSGLKDQHS